MDHVLNFPDKYALTKHTTLTEQNQNKVNRFFYYYKPEKIDKICCTHH